MYNQLFYPIILVKYREKILPALLSSQPTQIVTNLTIVRLDFDQEKFATKLQLNQNKHTGLSDTLGIKKTNKTF